MPMLISALIRLLTLAMISATNGTRPRDRARKHKSDKARLALVHLLSGNGQFGDEDADDQRDLCGPNQMSSLSSVSLRKCCFINLSICIH